MQRSTDKKNNNLKGDRKELRNVVLDYIGENEKKEATKKKTPLNDKKPIRADKPSQPKLKKENLKKDKKNLYIKKNDSKNMKFSIFKTKKNKFIVNFNYLKILGIIICLLFIAIIIIMLSLYNSSLNIKNDTEGVITNYSAEDIKPAIKVNDEIISVKDYKKNLTAFEKFYNKNSGLTYQRTELKNMIAKRLIKMKMLDQIAEQNAIETTNAKVEAMLKKMVYDKDGSAAHVNKMIKSLFGWTAEEYKKYIIKPMAMKENLREWLAQNSKENRAVKEKAESVYNELKEKIGESENIDEIFNEFIAKYNDYDVFSVDGYLGYLKKGDMPKEFETAAFNLNPGEISRLIKTKYGYHIIRVSEKLYDNNKKEAVIKAHHIFLKFKDIDQYIHEHLAKAKIRLYVN